MENTLAVEKALFTMYESKYDCTIDEMKMHKLMYFTQRESLIVNNEPLFDEKFLGWRYGPVLLSVREEFRKPAPFHDITSDVSKPTLELLKSVLNRFGMLSSWTLSIMSHEEFSWKLSRTGLSPSDNGSACLSIDAMRFDALVEASKRIEEV